MENGIGTELPQLLVRSLAVEQTGDLVRRALGAFAGRVVIQGPTDWNVSSWSSGLFAQDQWRVTDNFTLNLGMRYDMDGSLTALNALVRVDTGLHTINKDLNNVAPRLGISWTPFHDDKRTVIRGGAGLFYDQNHNNVATTVLLNNILVDRIVSVNANSPLLNPFWPDSARAKRLLAEGLARNEFPGLSVFGSVAGSTNDVDQRLQIPGTRQFSGGIEHEFGRWVSASADVVDAHGFDLYVIRNVNVDPTSFQRVNPNYSSINAFGNGGWNDYKALQVQVNVIPNADRLLKIAYTLATNRSNTNTTLSTGAATNPFDLSEDEGSADNDVSHPGSQWIDRRPAGHAALRHLDVSQCITLQRDHEPRRGRTANRSPFVPNRAMRGVVTRRSRSTSASRRR